MGHHISAIVSRLPFAEGVKERHDLPLFEERGFAIVGLNAEHSDFWAEKLGLDCGEGGPIILDNPVTHYFAEELFAERAYAIIETNYCGGHGDQAAAVYEAGRVVMPAKRGCSGVINRALKLVGVSSVLLLMCDRFDYLNLSKYRDFDNEFEKYWDEDD